jgi:hypothetical protein
MRGDLANSVTLGAAPTSDVPSVGTKPHLLERVEAAEGNASAVHS